MNFRRNDWRMSLNVYRTFLAPLPWFILFRLKKIRILFHLEWLSDFFIQLPFDISKLLSFHNKSQIILSSFDFDKSLSFVLSFSLNNLHTFVFNELKKYPFHWDTLKQLRHYSKLNSFSTVLFFIEGFFNFILKYELDEFPIRFWTSKGIFIFNQSLRQILPCQQKVIVITLNFWLISFF
jgi:hypothetical protein